MTALVTLTVAKQHLRVLHDDDDDDITLKAEQASEACMNYAKRRGPRPTDAEPTPPDWDETTVPKDFQAAVLLKLSDLYDNRNAGVSSDEYVALGYLSPAITALLHRYRMPAIA